MPTISFQYGTEVERLELGTEFHNLDRRPQIGISFTLAVDFEVRDIWAHMHLIGRDVKILNEPPYGKTRDVPRIPDWDFNWQDTDIDKKPFVLPKGTVVKSE